MRYLLIILFISVITSSAAQSKAKRGTITVKKNPEFEFQLGEGIFLRNCTFCHMPYYYSHEQRGHVRILTDATKNHSMSWLTQMLRYPGQLSKAGDPYMLAIDKKVRYYSMIVDKYPSRKHPDYHMLSNSQVMSVFFYVDSLNRRKLAWKEKAGQD